METVNFKMFSHTILVLMIFHGVFCADVLWQIEPFPGPQTPEEISWNARVLEAIPPQKVWYNDMEKFSGKISTKCLLALNLYRKGLKNLSPWAVKMVDATSKIPDGVMSGTLTHLGNFDQCLDVKAKKSSGEVSFTGQHCEINYKLGVSLNLAGCIPSTCSPQDMESVIQNLVGAALESFIGVNVSISIDPENCYTGHDVPPLDDAAWIMISVLILLVVLLCVGSIFDLYLSKIFENSGKAGEALKTFSVPRNWKFLSSIEHARGSFTCLPGIIVLSLIWIMMAHTAANELRKPVINTIQYIQRAQDIFSTLIHDGILGFDTFFFISGLLVCYVCLLDSKRGTKFNVFSYYIHRYVRLTTSYALLIGYYACLSSYVGYGPIWRPRTNLKADACRKNWWTSMLYVNNYVRDPQLGQCVGHGWCLTLDMQLFWLAPLVIIPLLKWPRWTMIAMPVLVLASCLAPFTWTYLNEGSFDLISNYLKPSLYKEYPYEMFYVTHMRATPYVVGVAFAYFMSKDLSKFKLHTWVVVCGWIVSALISVAIVLAPSMPFQWHWYEYDVVASSFYAGFHRLAWSMVLCWVVFACVHGYGGPVNSVLSWRMFLPLSRLSYCIYLGQFILMDYSLLTLKTLHYFTYFSAFCTLCSNFIFTVPLAMFMYFACEAPTIGLLKIFFKRNTGRKKTNDNKDQLVEKA